MGQPRIALDVKLFAAVTFNDEGIFDVTKTALIEKFGAIQIISKIFDFNFTEYYADEMGLNLKKQFLGFEKLIRPEALPDMKLLTNEIEAAFLSNGRRQVNIDPGYLTGANVVLATTKNFDHRMYLGKGIYGDVHLRYRREKFHFNEWTYPDYKDMMAIDFFARLRKVYMKEFRKLLKKSKKENVIEQKHDL
ncbi:MAG: DUF4416 family protein [bacterium]|nr:DUF4416 family protein [bacterium]